MSFYESFFYEAFTFTLMIHICSVKIIEALSEIGINHFLHLFNIYGRVVLFICQG